MMYSEICFTVYTKNSNTKFYLVYFAMTRVRHKTCLYLLECNMEFGFDRGKNIYAYKKRNIALTYNVYETDLTSRIKTSLSEYHRPSSGVRSKNIFFFYYYFQRIFRGTHIGVYFMLSFSATNLEPVDCHYSIIQLTDQILCATRIHKAIHYEYK